MKDKIKYTDEPMELGEIVDDSFLPSPEELKEKLKSPEAEQPNTTQPEGATPFSDLLDFFGIR
jgi:hypothetical protein